MEAVLDNVISGEILLKDLMKWLDSNKSDIEKLKLVNNFDFIPYFINYVKENSSWLLNKSDKQNETLISDEISPKKSNPSFNAQIEQPSGRDLANYMLKNQAEVHESTFQVDNMNKRPVSFQQSSVKENANKKVTLAFGCAPYQPKRKEIRPFKENLQNSKFRSMKISDSFHTFESKPKSNADINNLEAFPPLGGKVEDPKTKRRITPTPVHTVRNSSSNFGKSSFSTMPSNKVQNAAFRNSAFQDGGSDLQCERDLLKLARDQFVKQPTVPAMKVEAKPVDLNLNKVKPLPEPLIPDPEKVTMAEILSVFSDIYNFLISKALISNITSELFFMFELITSKITVKDEPKKSKNVFCSAHNCVHFAVSVLQQQCHLLYMLDNTTLASLCEIPFLLKFSSQLVSFLQQSLVKQDTTVSLPSLTRVPFQLDDDSRINFSDDNSFINFKKQRDMFYELLREWQGQSLQCVDGKYQEKFVRKAKLLISLGPNTLNMYHLARLLQCQLIASCMCFEVNEVYDEVVSDIQKNFPAKFKKLQERFLTPTRVGGLTPPPSFYGVQSFFSELIVAAASPSLNQHLMDSFVAKILELDDTDIFSDGELNSFGTLKDKYIFLLHTLRLLGKFLGFIHFLPYSSKQSIPLKIAEFHIEARKRAIPPLDLPNLLKKAASNSHIILTVPWVVEYLSMMDPLALNLEHIQESLFILTDITKWNYFPSKDLNSVLFLRLIIGWLFDVLHYPARYSSLVQPVNFQCSQEILKKGVDTVALIDKQLIHSCCPYLIEFKVLVFNYLNDVKNKREVRKITPFSTTQVNLSSINAEQQRESELEENFFSLHPQSLKKTSDFIAERMTSKAIGKIRSEVTNSKLSIVNDIVNSKAYKSISKSNRSNGEKKQEIFKVLDSSILGTYDSILYKVRDIKESIRSDIERTLPVLLSDDTKQSVIDICCKISFRVAVNKISDWCKSNLLIDAMKSDVKSKVKHIFDNDPDNGTDSNVNISQLLSVCREIILKLYSKSESINPETPLNLMSELNKLLGEETSKLIKKTIVFLSIDLFIALIVHNPENCCEKLTESFVLLWSTSPKNLINEKLFLCSQNMTFLLLSGNFDLSCSKFVYVVKHLLKDNVFSVTELQKCLKDMMKVEWQDAALLNTLERFTEVLSS